MAKTKFRRPHFNENYLIAGLNLLAALINHWPFR